jgi:signal transduction histidine kinase
MILIVDDTPGDVFLLKSLLTSRDFVVDTAASGAEALKKILKKRYSLVLLDVQMPDMTGFEVAELISGINNAKDTPIIFLSAADTEKNLITKHYTQGGTDYVTQPVDPDTLLLKVKKLSAQTKDHVMDTDHQSASGELPEQKVQEKIQDLTLKNEELEAYNDELQQFAWVASHDLKEPLRKIQTFNYIIRDKYLKENKEALVFLDKVIRSSERMSDLIDNLLDYSRLSASSLFKPTDLNNTLGEIISDLEIIISEKNASIRFKNMPVIDAIPDQVRQAFQNLISNGLKFSRKNIPPVITITADYVNEKNASAPSVSQGAYCRIRFEDNGIGIEEEFIERIFVIFQRLHTRDTYEGTGIGLAITRKIIDKHNGIISAQSKVNEGSVFTLVIPVTNNSAAK